MTESDTAASVQGQPFLEGVGPFTAQLATRAERYFDAVSEHPFFLELRLGQLSPERYHFYVIQDYLFLRAAGRVFNELVEQIHDDEWLVAFNRCASTVLRLEHSLQEQAVQTLGLEPSQADLLPLAPTNEAYTSLLQVLADNAPFAEALMVTLPCHWFYQALGAWLLEQPDLSPQHREWAAFYGGDAYDELVQHLLELAEDVGASLPLAQQQRCFERFTHACRYEWLFWEMCYHQEQWREPGV